MIAPSRIWHRLCFFRGRSIGIGVTVAPSLITVTISRWTLRGREPHHVITRDIKSLPEPWSALVEMLDEIREGIAFGEPLVHVALARPLGRAKIVELPPVKRSVVRQLMMRNAGKYFLLQKEASILADAVPLQSSWRRQRRRWIAGCADEEAVEAATSAIKAAGCTVGSITPASCALVEGLLALDKPLRTRRAVIRVEAEGLSEQIILRGGQPQRYLPLSNQKASPSSDWADGTDIGADVDEDGDPEFRLLSFDHAAPENEENASADCHNQSNAGVLASFGSLIASKALPLVIPSKVLDEHVHRRRHRIGAICAAALLLASAAGLLHLFDIDREIKAVRSVREDIATQVERATMIRNAAHEDQARIESVYRAVEHVPSHSVLLAEIARTLPASDYLVTYHGTTDELRMTGRVRSGTEIINALEGSDRFGEISFNLDNSDVPSEETGTFELTAELQEEKNTQQSRDLGRASGTP